MRDPLAYSDAHERDLAIALHALPEPPLGASTFPLAHARWRASMPARPRRMPWAVAASMAALLLIPLAMKWSSTPNTLTADQNAQAMWMSRSQVLEQAWQWRRAQLTRASADQVLVTQQMEDLISMIDTELETEANPHHRAELWANRVGVLENLNALEFRDRAATESLMPASYVMN